METYSSSDWLDLLSRLNATGIALSAEKNHDHLLDMILKRAKEMTNADGGTLYIYTENDSLQFEILHNDSLLIHKGKVYGSPISFDPIKLTKEDGSANMENVAACAVLQRQTINVPDAYACSQFNFTGTRKFDAKTGYRSKSFLTVPMTNHENDIIGVLQLINAIDTESKQIRPFSELDQQLVESLASQAAITLSNRTLIESQQKLFDSFVELIARAIDEKSPYTGGHCRRVPMLTNMIAEATCNIDYGPFKDFNMTQDEKYALNLAGWLHDCGKITTPEAVVDKGTKLETIFDRIELIDTRFEILKRDLEITALKRKLESLGENSDINNDELRIQKAQLDEDKKFIHHCNIGGEAISEEHIARLEKIATRKWKNLQNKKDNFLSKDELYNLKIFRGTLTTEERLIINNHIVMTIKMLESLPYPKHLTHVTEYAGAHHEKMDGSGYPNGLTREQISAPARMMGIADIFEALTAKDRPYKKAMPMSQALAILGRMKLDQHIDPDLFDVFIWQKIYHKYGKQYINPEQMDDFRLEDIPGYAEPPVSTQYKDHPTDKLLS